MQGASFAYKGEQHAFEEPRTEFERVVRHHLRAIRDRFRIEHRPPIAFTLDCKLRPGTRQELLAGITRIAGCGRCDPRRDEVSIELKVRVPRRIRLARFLHIIVHEILHTVVPIMRKPSCLTWSEGVTDFFAHWYLDSLDDVPRQRAYVERVRDADPSYYRFKRPYVVGASEMLRLYRRDPSRVSAALRRLVRDVNRTREGFFDGLTREEVVDYDSDFAVFFVRRSSEGRWPMSRWNTETPVLRGVA